MQVALALNAKQIEHSRNTHTLHRPNIFAADFLDYNI